MKQVQNDLILKIISIFRIPFSFSPIKEENNNHERPKTHRTST